MRLAAQTYVFGDAVKDPVAFGRVLAQVREAGYDAAEVMEPLPELPVLLSDAGVAMAALHTVLPKLAQPAEVARFLASCNCADVCSSGLMNWDERTADAYRAAAAALNEAGRALRGEGIHLHYHNHEFEFEKVEGNARGIDILLSGLDSAAVDLCLDMGWAHRAGCDAARFARDHADRIGFVHVRDFRGDVSTFLGDGDVPLDEHLAAARALPLLRWCAIEQDPGCADPADDMRRSLARVRRTGGA